MSERPETRADLTGDWTKRVCLLGSGSTCCRYLTMGPDGWGCEKNTSLGRYIDTRVEMGTFNAKGDNCPGLPEQESTTERQAI